MALLSLDIESKDSKSEASIGELNPCQIKKLSRIDSLLSNPLRQSADSVLMMFENSAITGLTPWVFISPQYDQLQKEYYSFIVNDILRNRLQMHFRSNSSRIKVKQDINDYVQVFRDIEDRIRKEDGSSLANRNVLFDVVTVNKIRRIKEGYETLKHFTQSARDSDSIILVQVNKELET